MHTHTHTKISPPTNTCMHTNPHSLTKVHAHEEAMFDSSTPLHSFLHTHKHFSVQVFEKVCKGVCVYMYCMENGDVSWYRIRFVLFVRFVWIRVNVEVKAAKVLCVGSECTIFFIFGAFLKKKNGL